MIYLQLKDFKDFELFAERLKNKREILERLGFDAKIFVHQAFSNQGLHRKNSWAERETPSIAGIFSDANKPGGQIRTRRLDSRPALQDTGTLKKSIDYRVQEPSVVLGTNVEYARVHQEGGYSVQVKTNEVDFDKKILAFVRTRMKGYPADQQSRVISLMNVEVLVTRVHKREFLGYSKKRAYEVVKGYILGEY